MAAEVIGSIVERDLLRALFFEKAALSDRLDAHMSARSRRSVPASRCRRWSRRWRRRTRRWCWSRASRRCGQSQDLLGFLAG